MALSKEEFEKALRSAKIARAEREMGQAGTPSQPQAKPNTPYQDYLLQTGQATPQDIEAMKQPKTDFSVINPRHWADKILSGLVGMNQQEAQRDLVEILKAQESGDTPALASAQQDYQTDLADMKRYAGMQSGNVYNDSLTNKYVGGVLESVPSLATSIAPAVVAAGVSGGAAIPAILARIPSTYSEVMGNTAEAALSRMKNPELNESANEAYNQALLKTGLPTLAVDFLLSVVGAKALNAGKVGLKGFAPKAIQESALAKAAADAAAKVAAKKAAATGILSKFAEAHPTKAALLGGALDEGGEEFVQSLATDWGGARNLDLGNAVDSAIIGGLGGAAMTGLGRLGLKNKQTEETAQDETKKPNEQAKQTETPQGNKPYYQTTDEKIYDYKARLSGELNEVQRQLGEFGTTPQPQNKTYVDLVDRRDKLTDTLNKLADILGLEEETNREKAFNAVLKANGGLANAAQPTNANVDVNTNPAATVEETPVIPQQTQVPTQTQTETQRETVTTPQEKSEWEAEDTTVADIEESRREQEYKDKWQSEDTTMATVPQKEGKPTLAEPEKPETVPYVSQEKPAHPSEAARIDKAFRDIYDVVPNEQSDGTISYELRRKENVDERTRADAEAILRDVDNFREQGNDSHPENPYVRTAEIDERTGQIRKTSGTRRQRRVPKSWTGPLGYAKETIPLVTRQNATTNAPQNVSNAAPAQVQTASEGVTPMTPNLTPNAPNVTPNAPAETRVKTAETTAQQPTETPQTQPQSQPEARTDNKPTATPQRKNIIRWGENGQHTAPVQYEIVEMGSLNPSNTAKGVNPNYPAELQPRDRRRADSSNQTLTMAQNLNPEMLGYSENAKEGAPIVDESGNVLSGNGRWLAVDTAYDNYSKSTGGKYKKWLKEHAAEYGADPDAVDKMKRPMLVRRVRDADMKDKVGFAVDANRAGIKQMSPVEQAVADAKALPDDALRLLNVDGDEDIDVNNAAFVQKFAKACVPAEEMPRFVDAQGNLSSEGVRRVQNALFAKAYGTSDEAVGLLSRLAESQDDNIRNITKALLNAAPRMAMLESSVARGETDAGMSINKMLTDTIQKLVRAKRDAEATGNWRGDFLGALNTGNIFEGGVITEQAQFGKYLADNMRRPRRLAHLLNTYAKQAMKLGQTNQGNIFGEDIPSRTEVFGNAYKTQIVGDLEEDMADKTPEERQDLLTVLFSDQDAEEAAANGRKVVESYDDVTPEEIKAKMVERLTDIGYSKDLAEASATLYMEHAKAISKRAEITLADYYHRFGNVIFNIASDENVKVLGQDGRDAAQGKTAYRGSIDLPSREAAPIVITINPKTADQSTLVHEFGHLFLHELQMLGKGENVSPQIAADLELVRKYFGNGDKPLTRAQHETFARSFEAYMREGKAPTPRLKKLFDDFKAWLTTVYRELKGLKTIKLNDDIRRFFDSMIAEDAEANANIEQTQTKGNRRTETKARAEADADGETQRLYQDANPEEQEEQFAADMEELSGLEEVAGPKAKKSFSEEYNIFNSDNRNSLINKAQQLITDEAHGVKVVFGDNVHHAFELGTFEEIGKAKYAIENGVKEKGIKGLPEIVKDISEADADDFGKYLAYGRLQDIAADRQTLLNEAEGYEKLAATERANAKEILRDLEKHKAMFSGAEIDLYHKAAGGCNKAAQLYERDAADCRKRARNKGSKAEAEAYAKARAKLAEAKPAFKNAEAEILKWGKYILEEAEQCGYITHGQREAMEKANPHYVPLYRETSKDNADISDTIESYTKQIREGILTPPDMFKSYKGKNKYDLRNPVKGIADQILMMEKLKSRQKVGEAILKNAREGKYDPSVVRIAEKGETADRDEVVFTVYQNGEPIRLIGDKETLKFMTVFKGDGKSMADKIFHWVGTPARMLREGVTLSPSFVLPNVLRDTVSAGVIHKEFIPIVDTVRGMFEMWGKGNMYDEWLKNGGKQEFTYGGRARRDTKIEMMYKADGKSKTTIAKTKDAVLALRGWLEKLSDLSEGGTRVGLYMKLRDAGMSAEEAAYQSIMLLPYSRGGTLMKKINEVAPFSNAAVQGNLAVMRALYHDGKPDVGAIVRLCKWVILPGILIRAWNVGDDDRKKVYDEIPTRDKNLYWHIVLDDNTTIRIPKPYESGIAASLVERTLDYFQNNDKMAYNGFMAGVWESLAPDAMPLLLKTAMELACNHSLYYDRDIVPESEQRYEAREQYGPSTSDTARWLAQGVFNGTNPLMNIIGKEGANISPRKIEYAIKGFTGNMGKDFLGLSDSLIRELEGKQSPEKSPLETMPVTHRFYTANRNFMRSEHELRTELDDALKKADSAALRAGHTPIGELSESDRQALRNKEKLHDLKNGPMKTVRDLEREIKDITADRHLSSERKRALIDQRQSKIRTISQGTLKKLRQITEAE